jgi:hypothetical protein
LADYWLWRLPDRDRAFYPTVLIVVGSYYVLFAAMGAPARVLWTEIAFAGFVALMAAIGFRRNLWLVAAMLAGHGVFDFFHASIITNPGVPRWWPGFCMTFDVVAGACMAFVHTRFVRPNRTCAPAGSPGA